MKPAASNQSRPAWWRYIRAVLLGIVLGISVEWSIEGAGGFPNDAIRPAYFDWNSRTGFKSFHIGGLTGPIIALQTKHRLAACLQEVGWRSARGWVDVPVFPVVIPVAFSPCNAYMSIDDPEETPLMHAADKGDLHSLQQLLAAGADVNARDQRGQTALVHACKQGSMSPAVVRALLRAGADVNAVDKGGSNSLSWVVPLLSAQDQNLDKESVRKVVIELLTAHADVNHETPEAPPSLRTPFLEAVMMGDRELVEAMLAGANIKRDGGIALATAESKGFTDIAELLRHAGAKH